MKENLELKLQAMLDGELPPSEARRLRELAQSDPAAGRLLEELDAVKTAFRGNETAVPVPETRSFYWSQIARQIERPERPVPVLTWRLDWRRLTAGLVGAGALALLLILAGRPSDSRVGFNQVSATAAGYEARTFRDQPSGLTFVFLHDTRPSGGATTPSRVREDGSSFVVESE